MKKNLSSLFVAFVTGIIVIATSCSEENLAVEVVEKSIEAHGGWDNFYALKKINYKKNFQLFDEEGILERDIRQAHSTTFHPVYKNKIVSYDTITLTYDGTTYLKTISGRMAVPTSADTGLIFSSIYVLAQPFKLMDPGVTLSYEGRDTLFNGREVEVVKAVYGEDGKENHPWWYYFDPDSNRCVGNLVDHNGDFSLIINDTYTTHSGILWNEKRTGYRTDQHGNVLFKRSDYSYAGYAD